MNEYNVRKQYRIEQKPNEIFHEFITRFANEMQTLAGKITYVDLETRDKVPHFTVVVYDKS